MKRLSIVALFLAAASMPWLATAADTDLCPTGSLGTSNNRANAANSTYTVSGCSIGASSSIVIDASGIPQGTSRSTIELVNSNIARNAIILFNLPTSNTVASRLIPLTISITGNTWAALSQLQFGTGALPPSSTLTIESNTWEKLTTLTPSPTTYLIQFAVLTMLQGAELNINENNFNMAELTNGTNIAGVVFNTVNMGNQGVVSISRNTFDMNGFFRKDCYGFTGNGVTFTMKPDAKILVDDNKFNIVNGIAWIFPRLAFDNTDSNRTSLSIQRNLLTMNSANEHVFAYHQEVKVNRLDGIVKDNKMTCVGCSGKWEWTRVMLWDNTKLEITTNNVTVHGGNVPQLPFTLTQMQDSTFTIVDNTMIAADQVLTNTNPWIDFGNVNLLTGGILNFIRNTLDAYYMPTRPTINAAETTSNFQIAKDGTTRIYMCGNDFYGTTPFSNDYVKLYMTPLIGAQLRPEQECSQLYLAAFNMTYEPMDSHATMAGSSSLWVVASAALATLIVGLVGV